MWQVSGEGKQPTKIQTSPRLAKRQFLVEAELQNNVDLERV